MKKELMAIQPIYLEFGSAKDCAHFRIYSTPDFYYNPPPFSESIYVYRSFFVLSNPISFKFAICSYLLVAISICGCGSTNTRSATEQLLLSDAVDRAIGDLNFAALKDQKVFLDTKYLVPVKGVLFVNAEYITSSLRQQLVAANCLLQDTPETADIIVEPRVGTLGTDGHEMTFGIPQSSTISSAAAVFSSSTGIPIIPEIALARSDSQSAAAKIAVFAYFRATREPVWQSGMQMARSSSKDTWILGAGPWQRGSIYERTHFAGTQIGGRKKKVTPISELPYMQENAFIDPSARIKQIQAEALKAEQLAAAEAAKKAAEAAKVAEAAKLAEAEAAKVAAAPASSEPVSTEVKPVIVQQAIATEPVVPSSQNLAASPPQPAPATSKNSTSTETPESAPTNSNPTDSTSSLPTGIPPAIIKAAEPIPNPKLDKTPVVNPSNDSEDLKFETIESKIANPNFSIKPLWQIK